MKRWSVPWSWPIVFATFVFCELSSKGIELLELHMEEGAKQTLLKQIMDAAAALGILFCVMYFHQSLPEDLFHWDVREPFNLQEGWLLWAIIGLISAYTATKGTLVAVDYFPGRASQPRTNKWFGSVGRLYQVTGSPRVSLICLLIGMAVLPPLVEEYVFRGFLMASMTKWLSTPIAVMISAVVFALSHWSIQQLPHLFVIGTVFGLSYAQTRNLMTPLTIHSLWNFGITLINHRQLHCYNTNKDSESSDINQQLHCQLLPA